MSTAEMSDSVVLLPLFDPRALSEKLANLESRVFGPDGKWKGFVEHSKIKLDIMSKRIIMSCRDQCVGSSACGE